MDKIRRFFVMKKYFIKLLYNAKINIHLKNEQDLLHEHNCYYLDDYNYLM